MFYFVDHQKDIGGPGGVKNYPMRLSRHPALYDEASSVLTVSAVELGDWANERVVAPYQARVMSELNISQLALCMEHGGFNVVWA
jgi:hypothetical protein